MNLSSDDCPSRAAMDRFVDGSASKEESQVIDSHLHLDECEKCLDLWENLCEAQRDREFVKDVGGSTSNNEGFSAGDKIDDYEVVRVVGVGGFGIVYEAKDQSGNSVAVKVAQRDTRSFSLAVESVVAGSLEHPNIVSILDKGHTGSTPYVVYEFIDGTTLRRKLNDGPMPLQEAIDIVNAICKGVSYCHEQKKLYHRDIKPENVLVDNRSRQVFVSDFGIAVHHDATEYHTNAGTQRYMSPEQKEGDVIDGRSDLWSIGAIFYEMLTGEHPLEGGRSHPTPPIQLNSTIPAALSDACLKCLEFDPSKRFPTVSAFRDTVDTIGSGRRGHWKRWLIAALLLVGISMFGRIYMNSNQIGAVWPEDPHVLFIGTGDTGYGKQHEAGVRQALDATAEDISLVVLHEYYKHEGDHHPLGYDADDLARLKKEVKDVLDEQNVIAIIGPCGRVTRTIVNYVHTINEDIPIILESPTSRQQLGYEENNQRGYGPLVPGKPVYRISSGLDERIPHMSSLVRQLIQHDASVCLLSDETPYAREIRDGILKNLRLSTDFQESHVSTAMISRKESYSPEDAVEPMKADFVLYLGTGGHFIGIANACINPQTPTYFAGIMNAWAFNLHPPLVADADVLPYLIDFEDIGYVGQGQGTPEERHFLFNNSSIGPSSRDVAFSYDAAICVRNAWQDALEKRLDSDDSYADCLKLVQSALERPKGHDGVTGHITFPAGAGQNAGLKKTFVFHRAEFETNAKQQRQVKWIDIKEEDIVSLVTDLRAKRGG